MIPFPLAASEFKRIDIDAYRAIAVNARTGRAATLDPVELELLESLVKPANGRDELVGRLLASKWDRDALSDLDSMCQALLDQGFLIDVAGAVRDIAERGRAAESNREGSPPALSALAWMTRDRPAAIARAIAAWKDRVEEAGIRPPAFVISDDSRLDPEATRRVVAAISEGYGGSTYYLGHPWRERFVASFSKDLAGPAAFALGLSGQAPGGSFGANGNAFLLALGGRLFAMSDDDILPDFRVRPDAQDGLAFQSEPDPSLFIPVAGASEFDELGAPSDRPVFYPHETYLGRSLGELLSRADSLDLSGLRASSVYRASHPEARVAAICFHYWGDSGMNQARHLQSARDRVAPGAYEDARYDAIRRSRLQLRAPVRDTLCGSAMLNGHLELDARRLLPPFSPGGRNQDGLWGFCLGLMDERDFLLYPKEAIRHAPIDPRAAADPLDQAWSPGQNGLTIWILDEFARSQGRPVHAYAVIGAHLTDLGSRRSPELEAYLRELTYSRMVYSLSQLEAALSAWREPPAWVSDLEAAIGAIETALDDTASWVPSEYRDDPGGFGAYLKALGELFSAWPELMNEAASLREGALAAGKA